MLPFLSPLAAVSVLTRILGVMIPSDTLSSVDRGKREEHQAPTNWALAPGTLYFLKVAEVVDITGRLKTFPICVAALKSSVGFDKVRCTHGH